MTEGSPPHTPPPRPSTPYIGLVPYREEDAEFFFGRDKEKRVVAGNLRASRLTVLYGPSGVGKTSLLQAGVVREIREQVREGARAKRDQAPFAICVFRDWRDDPVPAVMEAIRAAAVEALGGGSLPAWRHGESLTGALQEWTKRVRTLLVVLDQFEDYFLYHADEDGEGTFAREFPAIVNEPNLRVNFLLSIREEAWAKLDLFKGRIPRLFANYVRVEHLSRAAAREAIEGPVREWNRRLADDEKYTIESALVEAVIDAAAGGRLALAQGDARADSDATSREHVEAPFLQLVMERVWRATVDAASRDLTVLRLEKLGGPRRIVENHLLEALGTLTSDEQAVAADLFRFLVTRSKTKIAHPASDLADWTGLPEPEVASVLDKLCRGESGRILRRVPPPAVGRAATRYELFHDVLAEPILDWRRDYEQERARKAAFRKFARIGGSLLALAGIFAALGVWALVQRSEAQTATRSATSLALASAGREELGSRPEVALLLGLEAYRASPSAEAASTTVDALVAARRSGAETILRTDRGIRAIALSPDGRTLASADFGGTLRLWDVQARTLARSLQGHTGEIWSVAFSPDGSTLASASLDGTLRLWAIPSLEPLGQLPAGETGAVTSVAFSPEGETLASGGEAGSLRLWDVQSRSPRGAPLEGHTDRVVSVAFSPDGRTLVSAGYDGRVLLWDVRSRRQVGRLGDGHRGGVLSVAFSPDGRTLATSGFDETVRLWDVPSLRSLGPALSAQAGEIWSVRFSPDGRTIAAPGFDKTVRLWDVRSRRQLGEPFRGHTDRVVSVAFTPDGRTLASSGYDGTVRLWTMPNPTTLAQPLRGHDDQVKSVAFAPDGRTLASAGFAGTLLLWDVRTRKPILRFQNETDSLESVAFSPDGDTLASAGSDGSISLWDVASGRPLGRLQGHEGAVQSISFSPDGGTLGSAGQDGTVAVWDTEDPTSPAKLLRGHEGPVWSLAFSPDGRTLATAGFDQTVRLWDVRTGRETGQLPLGGREAVQSIAFSPNGRTLASGDAGGPVRLWDVGSRTPLGEPLSGHEDRVGSVTFSRDGRMLASASDDGTVRLWDVPGHRSLGQPLNGHTGAVFSVAFSPDGRTLVSGGDDRTVRLWEGILWSDFPDLRAQVCRLVVGNLTRSEWEALAPGLSYRTTCEE